MTTRGVINSNFYQIVNVDANGTPTTIKPEYITGGNATNANYANFAGNAFSVSVGNVVGIGNIATINLSANGQQVLLGNGTWGDKGNLNAITNGNSNVSIPNINGNVYINANASVDQQWNFGTDGNITVTGNGQIGNPYNDNNTVGLRAGPTGYAILASNDLNQYVQTDDSAVYIGTNYPANNHNWTFQKDGNTLFPSNNTVNLGNLAIANLLTGRLTTSANAQPNVTSLGTLTGVTVNGLSNLGSVSNVKITGGTNGYVLQTDGAGNLTWTAQTGNGGGGNGTPGGANTQIQYNNAGNFGASGNLTFDSATNVLTVGGNIDGAYISGDGSKLTNITGANVTGQVANALVAGTVYTADQPNITNVGTLLNLAVTGNISASNIQATTSITTVDLTVTGNANITGNINQISGNSGQFFGNATTGFGALYAGVPIGYSNVPQTVLQVAGNYNGYIDINLQNINSGSDASTDISVLADNGNVTNYFIDMGITSTTYDSAGLFTSLDHNDGYVYVVGGDTTGTHGNLILGSITPNAQVKFIVGGANTADIAAIVNQPNTNSTNNTSGTITIAGGLGVTGNIYGGNLINANYFSGNGSLLTGITSTTGNANYANFAGQVVDASQSNITSVGTLVNVNTSGQIISTYAGNASTGGGQLYLNGSSNNRVEFNTNGIGAPTTTTRSDGTKITLYPTLSSLQVDYAIGINSGALWTSLPGYDAGQSFKWYGGTTEVANLTGTGSFAVAGNIKSLNANLGNLTTSNYFSGNGSLLTGITSTTGNANYANFAGNVVNASQSNITSVGTLTSLAVTGGVSANIFTSNVATGNAPFIVTSTTQVGNLTVAFANVANTANAVAGGNVSGQVGNALIAGTVYTNAQPNITSVGTLTGLSVSSSINANSFTSNVATGTAPLTVTSTTRVTNLNVAYANVSDYGVVTTQTTGTFYPVFVNANTSANYAHASNANLSFNAATGNLSATLLTGTLTTAAQPNITSTGSLTSLTVTGNLTAGNIASAGLGNVANVLFTKYNETVVAGGSTGAATLTPNAAAGTIYNYTLTGNITINALGNAVAGTGMTLILTQDGTGNRTLTSTMKFLGGSKTLSTAASAIDIMSVFYDGTTYYASLGKGFA
jgi:hypothetical protein